MSTKKVALLSIIIMSMAMVFLLATPPTALAGDVCGGKKEYWGVFVGTGVHFDNAKKVYDALDAPICGWKKDHKTLIKKGKATKANIEKEINAFKNKAKPGDVFIFYYAGHGQNGEIGPGGDDKLDTKPECDKGDLIRNGRIIDPNGDIDTKTDPRDEDLGAIDGARGDPKDEPDRFDNIITTDDGWITDDELTKMLSNFKYGVSIVIVLEACWSSSFTDGTADPVYLNLKDKKASIQITQKTKGGKDTTACDVEILGSKGMFPDAAAASGPISEGLKEKDKTGKTVADSNKDGITTLKELTAVVEGKNWKWKRLYYDNDGDNLTDEDYVDQIMFPNGTIITLYIDNDMDGLIDEDPDPVNWTFAEVISVPPEEVPAITPLSFILALLSLFGLGAITMRKMYKR